MLYFKFEIYIFFFLVDLLSTCSTTCLSDRGVLFNVPEVALRFDRDMKTFKDRKAAVSNVLYRA